jgi:hypothetical protein
MVMKREAGIVEELVCGFRRSLLDLCGEMTYLRMRSGESAEGEDDHVQVQILCISLINQDGWIIFFFSTPLEHARESDEKKEP